MGRIVITGGGTGGHVFPALAIAEALKAAGYEVSYVGSTRGLEARLAPQKGIPFHAIRTGMVKNQNLLRVIGGLFQLAWSTLWSLGYLVKNRTTAVVGVGGYVSVPICFAAFLLRRPVYLQEQNASVGIANRFLGKLAKRIFLGFPEAESAFPPAKTMVTGNPIRAEFFSPDFPPLDPNKLHILIFGGSQGARTINRVITSRLESLRDQYPDIFLHHQTGQTDFPEVAAAYEGFLRAEVVPFIEDMAEAFGEASLVVCRSGALTISELIQVGRPAILVPYPRRGQNDQTSNAQMLETAGAARVVEQGEGFEKRFWDTLEAVFKPEKLAEMARNFIPLRRDNPLVSIVRQIQNDLG